MEPVSGAWACMESGGRCWGQVVGTHGVAIGLVSRASTVLGGAVAALVLRQHNSSFFF